MKKTLSLILSFVMLLSTAVFPLSAYAASDISEGGMNTTDITLVDYGYAESGLPADLSFYVDFHDYYEGEDASPYWKRLNNGVDYTATALAGWHIDRNGYLEVTVKITGMGNYSGTYEENFKIPAIKGKQGKISWKVRNSNKSFIVSGSGALNGNNIVSPCFYAKKVVISNGITSVKNMKLERAQKLYIASSVKTIYANTFEDSYDLKNLYLEKGVEKIGKEAFLHSKSLKTVYIPKSVKSIGTRALGYYWYDTGDDEEGMLIKKLKGFTVCGLKGSAAQKYAKKNGFKFISFAQPSIKAVSAKSKAFKVSWKALSSVSGYQLQYSTTSDFASVKTVKITKKSAASKTVKKLSSKKKYYVRIRSYKKSGGKTYYSSWSKAKAVTVK